MVVLTEQVGSDRLADAAGLKLTVTYVFTRLGKEVTHMFSFYAESPEQYEQYNQFLHPGITEPT